MTESINYWELPEQWLTEEDDNEIPEEFAVEDCVQQPDELIGVSMLARAAKEVQP